MDRDEYADMFRYRVGQEVRWAEHPENHYRVAQRRWTQREILAPLVAYRLRRVQENGTLIDYLGDWIGEADMEGWEEAT